MARNKFIIEMKRKYMSESDSDNEESQEFTDEEMKVLVAYVLEGGQEFAKKFLEFEQSKKTQKFLQKICRVLPVNKTVGVELWDIYHQIYEKIGCWGLIGPSINFLGPSLRAASITYNCKNPALYFASCDIDELFDKFVFDNTCASAMIYYTAYPEKVEYDLEKYSKDIQSEISARKNQIEMLERSQKEFNNLTK